MYTTLALEWSDPDENSVTARWQGIATDANGHIRIEANDARKMARARFRVVAVPAVSASATWGDLRDHAVKTQKCEHGTQGCLGRGEKHACAGSCAVWPLVTGLANLELPANGEDLAGYSFDTFWALEKATSERSSELIGYFYDEHSARSYADKHGAGFHGLKAVERQVKVITKTGSFVGWPLTIGEMAIAAATDEMTHLRIRALAKLTPEERAALGV